MEDKFRVRKVAGYPLTARIMFDADRNGVPYGPDNNPLRKRTNMNKQFALLHGGMTLHEALTIGVWPNVLRYMHHRGYIKIAA